MIDVKLSELLRTEQAKFAELSQNLEIDLDNLELEQENQSQLFYDASQGYARAFSRVDEAKLVLEQIEANLAREYRQTSTEKITENTVKEFVKQNERYVNQEQFRIEREKEMNEWKGLMRAYDQRADRLRDLVSMLNMGYFGSGLTDTQKRDAYIAARRAKTGGK